MKLSSLGINVILISILFIANMGHAAVPVRLKNFREMYSSLESITNINGQDKDLLELYRFNRDRLPRVGAPQEFSSPMVLALTELSGAFCQKAVLAEKTVDRGERTLFSLIDFTRGPEQFNDFLVGRLSDHLGGLFWQRDTTVAEKELFVKAVADLSNEDKETPAETEKVLQALCTCFASSLSFIVK